MYWGVGGEGDGPGRKWAFMLSGTATSLWAAEGGCPFVLQNSTTRTARPVGIHAAVT